MTSHVKEQNERHLALLVREDYHESRQLIDGKNAAGIAGFTALLVFLTVLLVSNLVAGATGGDPWNFLGNDNDYFTGALGSSYDNIRPCDKLPLASNELFGYRKFFFQCF